LNEQKTNAMNLTTELGRRRWINAARGALDPERFTSWLEGFVQRHPPIPSDRPGPPAPPE